MYDTNPCTTTHSTVTLYIWSPLISLVVWHGGGRYFQEILVKLKVAVIWAPMYKAFRWSKPCKPCNTPTQQKIRCTPYHCFGDNNLKLDQFYSWFRWTNRPYLHVHTTCTQLQVYNTKQLRYGIDNVRSTSWRIHHLKIRSILYADLFFWAK